MSKRRERYLKGKSIALFTIVTIGLVIIFAGGLYMISAGVNVIKKGYVISIPNKYYGEIVLSPEGGQRLDTETILNISSISIEKGVTKSIARITINRTYIFVVARVEGNASEAPINIVLYLSNMNGTIVGGTQYVNKSSIINSENILVFSPLPQGSYELKILSNSDTFVRRIMVRGIYYKEITNPLLSVELRPEGFTQHTLYYIDSIDLRNLLISMFLMLLGFTMIILSLMIYIVAIVRKY